VRLPPTVLASVLALAFYSGVGQPALAKCPARVSSAAIIGSTSSGLSSIYAISVDIDEISDERTLELNSMHLFVRDDAGNETWVLVPSHTVSDLSAWGHLDYFSFGWRRAQRFEISISDVTFGDKPTAVCGDDWQSFPAVGGESLAAGNKWDDWSRGSRPTIDLVAFHPPRVVERGPLIIHDGGPTSAECGVLVTVDSAGRAAAFDVHNSSGYLPFDNECIDAAKRSTYKAASFGNVNVPATWLIDAAYVTID
jgi:hypothetical protein